MAVTNEQIIFNAQCELVDAGKIGVDENGNPEEIHTFQFWKDNGYKVRKGAKAVVELSIWKLATKRKLKIDANADGEDDDANPRFFLKRSWFFSRSQVDRI